MPADKLFAGSFQKIDIKRSRDVPHAAELQRRKNRAIPNSVTIKFSFRRIAGVKILGDTLTTKNSNRRGQICIERTRPLLRRQFLIRKIDMGALRERVNAGVGPPRAMNSDSFADDFLKRGLEFVLNRFAMRLALPTRERGAVVRDDELKSP